MKKLLVVLSLVALVFSCSSGPEKAAKDFTENLAKGKVVEAKKFATEATGQLLDLASSMGTVDVYPDYKFMMEKDSIVDNKAWVTYLDPEGNEETIELVNIDGEWLVHIEAKK